MIKLSRLTFEERMQREIKQRGRQSTPRQHLLNATMSLVIAFVATVLMVLNAHGFLSMLQNNPEYLVMFIFAGVALSYTQAFVATITDYSYQRRLQKYYRSCRAAELSAEENDIISTVIPVNCGKIVQK